MLQTEPPDVPDRRTNPRTPAVLAKDVALARAVLSSEFDEDCSTRLQLTESEEMKVVLILDDDPDFRAQMCEAFTQANWRVLEAASAAEADEAIQGNPVDLAVVDGRLGGVSGMDWIRARVAANAPERHVFVSAYFKDLASFDKLTKELGVLQVFYKPLNAPSAVAEMDLLCNNAAGLSKGAVTDSLEKLRDPYIRSLADKFAEIERFANDISDPDKRESALASIVSLVHRLHGTAGTYGLHAISKIFGDLENELHAMLGGVARVDQVVGLVRRAVIRAKVELSRLQSTKWTSPVAYIGETVLVLASSRSLLNAAGKLRGQLDAELVHVGELKRAIELASRSQVRAVVLEASYLEELKGLGKDPRDCFGIETPLVLVTESDSLESRVQATQAGINRVLPSPVEPRVLSEALRDVLAFARSKRPRVLLVDDDPDFVEFVSKLLESSGYHVESAPDAGEAYRIMQEDAPELVLLDVHMPAISGFDLCRAIRSDSRWAGLPILMVTADATDESKLACFKAGADDYITKPIFREELVTRIGVRVERTRLQKFAAERDSLTGLLLRRPFLESFASIVERARRRKDRLCLAIIDLDRFKNINDEHGHLAGDEVLKTFGKIIRESLRMYDLACRWGGEEFLLALPGEDANFSAGVLDRLRARLTLHEFEGKRGKFHVNFTAGIAEIPREGDAIDVAIATADKRLYAGKKSGRGRTIAG